MGPTGRADGEGSNKILEETGSRQKMVKYNGNERSAHKAKQKEETGEKKNGDGGVLRVDESIYSLSLQLG